MTTAASPAGRWKGRLSRTLLYAVRARRVEVKPPFSTTLTKGAMVAERFIRLPIIKPGSIVCPFAIADCRARFEILALSGKSGGAVRVLRPGRLHFVSLIGGSRHEVRTHSASVGGGRLLDGHCDSPPQAVSTAASAYSNSAAAAPKMPHAARRLDTAQAQTHPRRTRGYGSMQRPIADRRPSQDDLQPTQDDLEKIDKDNQQLDLPASQDDIIGAGQDALTKRIGQDNPRVDNEIKDICPSCGEAEDARPVHQRPWPTHNGFNHQPTQDELRALQQDITRDQAQETERLYDQLMSGSSQILRQYPARAP